MNAPLLQFPNMGFQYTDTGTSPAEVNLPLGLLTTQI